MYACFGTRVVILHRRSSILSSLSLRAEEQLTERLRKILIDEGITIKTGVEVKAVRKEARKKILSYLIKGKQEEVSVEELLIATGKAANTKGLGLEKVGVEINERQVVVVNDSFQTSNPHVFAVGDVTN